MRRGPNYRGSCALWAVSEDRLFLLAGEAPTALLGRDARPYVALEEPEHLLLAAPPFDAERKALFALLQGDTDRACVALARKRGDLGGESFRLGVPPAEITIPRDRGHFTVFIANPLPLSHHLSTGSGTGAATGRSSVRGKG